MSDEHRDTASDWSPERVEINLRPVGAFAAGLLLLLAVCLLPLWWLAERRQSRSVQNPLDVATTPPSIKTLGSAPLDAEQLQHRHEYESRQRELLNGYGWIDRGRGIVRIPVGRAEELLIERQESPR